MFRGGPVSSYGTGIASGLGYNTGGRVGYSNGGGIITLQDIPVSYTHLTLPTNREV